MDNLFDATLPMRQHNPSLFDDLRGRLCQKFPELFEHPELDEAKKRERIETAVMYARNYFYETQQNHSHRLHSSNKEGGSVYKPPVPNTHSIQRREKPVISNNQQTPTVVASSTMHTRTDIEVINLTNESPSPPPSKQFSRSRGLLRPRTTKAQPADRSITAFARPCGSTSVSKQITRVKVKEADVAIPQTATLDNQL
ncbi:hypothetical protein NP233_g9766 [Leucocoprinus birnbaumii]|uniref:Uncharacterized protein n=1 Tax=Leucocoprinus birnbaumii TaxID=56174 RepID=A0AAD5VM53_9AGAR|nr:hypothetical protein NP233_g9766 [Leucocoprinus birnbaumii]